MICIKYLRELNLSNFFIYKLKKKTTSLKMFVFYKNINKSFGNNIIVNNKPVSEYFTFNEASKLIKPLIISNLYKKYCLNIFIFITGGGLINQRKTIEQAIEKSFFNNSHLDVSNYFTSTFDNYKLKDTRKKERKKFGLKKARKASQYHKR